MESSTEPVRKQPDPQNPLQVLPVDEAGHASVPDEYAQSELESRTRRIEQSIEKALRTT